MFRFQGSYFYNSIRNYLQNSTVVLLKVLGKAKRKIPINITILVLYTSILMKTQLPTDFNIFTPISHLYGRSPVRVTRYFNVYQQYISNTPTLGQHLHKL